MSKNPLSALAGLKRAPAPGKEQGQGAKSPIPNALKALAARKSFSPTSVTGDFVIDDMAGAVEALAEAAVAVGEYQGRFDRIRLPMSVTVDLARPKATMIDVNGKQVFDMLTGSAVTLADQVLDRSGTIGPFVDNKVRSWAEERIPSKPGDSLRLHLIMAIMTEIMNVQGWNRTIMRQGDLVIPAVNSPLWIFPMITLPAQSVRDAAEMVCPPTLAIEVAENKPEDIVIEDDADIVCSPSTHDPVDFEIE